MPVKISGLPAGTALTGTEQVPVVQSSVTVRSTALAFYTYVLATLTTNAAAVRTALGAAASGANTDITSLASPAIAAATATTQLSTDNSTKVATTAQVASAIAAIPAANAAKVGGVSRKAQMSVTAASATGTFTADEIVVETALGGASSQVLASYSQACNLATTGAGGMDTGTAPISGFVSLYAIAKADGTKSILACAVATSTGSVYGGANFPSGYTYSALLGIWPTNGSSQFIVGLIQDRKFFYQTFVSVFTAHALITTLTTQSISSAVPTVARTASFLGGCTANGNIQLGLAADATGTGAKFATTAGAGTPTITLGGTTTLLTGAILDDVPLITAQTVFVLINSPSAVGSTNNLYVTGYTI